MTMKDALLGGLISAVIDYTIPFIGKPSGNSFKTVADDFWRVAMVGAGLPWIAIIELKAGLIKVLAQSARPVYRSCPPSAWK